MKTTERFAEKKKEKNKVETNIFIYCASSKKTDSFNISKTEDLINSCTNYADCFSKFI